MTRYEQELRKLFDGSGLMDRPQYSGRVCVGELGKDLRVRAEFFSAHVADQYDAIRLTVLNRKEGVVDRTLLQFKDVWGKKPVPSNPNFRSGVMPHLWDDHGDVDWYVYHPSAADYDSLRQAIGQYLSMFRERTPEWAQDGPKLVFICAPLRGDVEKNIEFARQKAQEEAQQAKLERHRQEGLAREAACKQEEQLRQAQKEQAAREQAEAEAKARREREARILAEEHTAQAERRRKYGRICLVTMLLAPAGAALSATFTWLEALLGGRLWLLRLLLELLALAASLIGCCGPELAWSAAANLKGLKTAQKALPSLLAAAALIVTFRVTGEGATAYIVAALLNGLLFRKFCKG